MVVNALYRLSISCLIPEIPGVKVAVKLRILPKKGGFLAPGL